MILQVRLLAVVPLACILLGAATAQSPSGFPFEVDPGLLDPNLDKTGMHLNLPNGMLDNGEVATDFGGSTDAGLNPFPCPLPGYTPTNLIPFNPHSIVYSTIDYLGVPMHVFDGIVCGFQFRMIQPPQDQEPIHTQAAKFAGFTEVPDLRGVAMVVDQGTRAGNLHTPHQWLAHGPGPLNGWGATTVYANDVIGGTPAVISVQRGFMLGAWMRDLGYPYVVRGGGSYGALVCMLTSVIANAGGPEAQIFDGIMPSGANSSMPDWVHFHEYFRARQLAEGGGPPPYFPYHDTATDQIEMALGQYGLHSYDVDVYRAPERMRLPTLLLHGLNDHATGSDNLDAATQMAFEAEPGINDQFLRLFSLEESGHGEPDMTGSPDVYGHWPPHNAGVHIMREFAEAVLAGGPTSLPPSGNEPRTRVTTFDHVCRHVRNETLPPQFAPAWEVGAYTWEQDPGSATYGGALRRGLGTELAKRGNTSAILGNDLFTLGLEGYLMRHRWNGTGFDPSERFAYVGIEPQCMTVSGNLIYVGSQLGLTVLDATLGTTVTQVQTHSKIRALTVADLSLWTTRLRNGPHVIYVGENHVLTVLDANHNEVLEAPIGSVGRIKVKLEDRGLGTKPYLYASLIRGHVARFRLEERGASDVVPVAEMITDYLEFSPIDFEFVDVGGTDAIVTAGWTYPWANFQGPNPDAWVAVYDQDDGDALVINGSDNRLVVANGIQAEIEHMFLDGDQLYLGILEHGAGKIERVDTNSWTSTTLPNANGPGTMTGGGAFVADYLTGSGTPDLVRFPQGGSIEVYDMTGQTLRGGLEGRTPTTAVTLTHNSVLDRWELCVLDRDWYVRRYDAASGGYLDMLQITQPVAVDQTKMFLPKRLVRTDPNTFTEGSFEYFLFAGTMFPEDRANLGSSTAPVRVSYAGSGLIAAPSFTDEHNYLLLEPDFAGGQQGISGLKNFLPAPGVPTANHVPRMTSEIFATGEAAVITVDIPGSDPGDGANIVFSNPSGNVRVLADLDPLGLTSHDFDPTSPWSGNYGPSQSPGVTGESNDTMLRLEALDVAALATGELDGLMQTTEVVAGAMVPAANGDSLFVLDVASGSAVQVASIAAGAVSGVTIGDVDGDDLDNEIIVGTIEGQVIVYDHTLTMIAAVDTRAMQVGNRGTMWLLPAGALGTGSPPRLICSHSQGVTAYDLSF